MTIEGPNTTSRTELPSIGWVATGVLSSTLLSGIASKITKTEAVQKRFPKFAKSLEAAEDYKYKNFEHSKNGIVKKDGYSAMKVLSTLGTAFAGFLGVCSFLQLCGVTIGFMSLFAIPGLNIAAICVLLPFALWALETIYNKNFVYSTPECAKKQHQFELEMTDLRKQAESIVLPSDHRSDIPILIGLQERLNREASAPQQEQMRQQPLTQ